MANFTIYQRQVNRQIETLMDCNALACEGQRHAKALKAYVLCNRFIKTQHFDVLMARQRQIEEFTAVVIGELESELRATATKRAA